MGNVKFVCIAAAAVKSLRLYLSIPPAHYYDFQARTATSYANAFAIEKFGQPEILRQTYMSVFEYSELADCKRIVFPAIGFGIYRWPTTLDASIALAAPLDRPREETIVRVHDDANFYAYINLI